MRVVYQAENGFDAHLVRHALEHEGIPAFVLGDGLIGGIGELPVLGYCRVVVADDHVDVALDCIRSLDLRVVDDDDPEFDPLPAPAG